MMVCFFSFTSLTKNENFCDTKKIKSFTDQGDVEMEVLTQNDTQMRICSKAQLNAIKKAIRKPDACKQDDAGIVGIQRSAGGENKKKMPIHQLFEVQRREEETASNYYQRCRIARQHPYFLQSGTSKSDTFLILEVEPEGPAKELPVFTSRFGHRYMYDEQSPWWIKLDKKLVRMYLLREHRLKKLHSRFVAQQDMVQNVFRNQRISGCKDLRLSASDEFKIASTAAEYLNLVVPVKEEKNVWKKNKALIQADEDKSDYEQGEWNNLYERYCRLPRCVSFLFFCDTKKNDNLVFFVTQKKSDDLVFFVTQKYIVLRIKLLKQKPINLMQK